MAQKHSVPGLIRGEHIFTFFKIFQTLSLGWVLSADETSEYTRTPDSDWSNREPGELPCLGAWKWHVDVGQGSVVNVVVLS